tara:strand:- start:145 stop:723 length:579 start_codon:yes stop_codon:yes gene_type:complete
MDEKEEIAKQTLVEDEKPKETLADKLKAQKKQARKKTIKRTILFSVLALFSWCVWFLFKPFQASAEYGICRTMLELTVPYPYSIYVSEVKNKRDGALEMWYTHTDGFGEYRMESFTCRMRINPETNTTELTEIKMHKVTMDPQKLANLNNAMPYFVATPLILNYPAALPDSIGDLQFDFNKFRRVKIDDIKK